MCMIKYISLMVFWKKRERKEKSPTLDKALEAKTEKLVDFTRARKKGVAGGKQYP